ncbi:MAG: methylated-DNA--[protein]-cysteine S-methyltransferase [Halioglobus sp.]|nr:methylated-DNA--[protein]-cysteine S-methyltransferase [Halioglobus sp.]
MAIDIEYMTRYEPDINHRIWQVVATIPEGKVATYGSVAKKAGLGSAARRVGPALRGLPAASLIPWHRVINAQGRLSLPNGSAACSIQRGRLEKEGIVFKKNNSIDLKLHGW